ncbi:MAG: hypothetical protein L6437_15230, partial [Kiritimatiellae bacterium]|nr:hypothetical protein [Kiritimatiellia bacterium]
IKIFIAVPLYKTPLYTIAQQTGLLEHNEEFPMIDWRYAQIKSPEWSAKDISILRAYEWDRINFAPEKIKILSKMTGLTRKELSMIRKRTRDSLVF